MADSRSLTILRDAITAVQDAVRKIQDDILSFKSWLNDNGAWGAKTKLAKLWDWYVKWQGKEIKIEAIDSKVDKAVCDIRHKELLEEIRRMIEKRDKNWRWWVEQLKWMLPMALAFLMWLSSKGII